MGKSYIFIKDGHGVRLIYLLKIYYIKDGHGKSLSLI